MATVDPIVTNRIRSTTQKTTRSTLSPETQDLIKSLPLDQQKKILKRIDAFTFPVLYNIALGLPSRIRRFVKHIWKREDRKNESWPKIATEMAPEAAKILIQRIELVTFTGYAITEHPSAIADGRLDRMTAAKSECDALLCLYAHYFTIGVSAQLSVDCTSFTGDGAEFFLGGLVAVVDYGLMTPRERRASQAAAMKAVKSNGWKIPERITK